MPFCNLFMGRPSYFIMTIANTVLVPVDWRYSRPRSSVESRHIFRRRQRVLRCAAVFHPSVTSSRHHHHHRRPTQWYSK